MSEQPGPGRPQDGGRPCLPPTDSRPFPAPDRPDTSRGQLGVEELVRAHRARGLGAPGARCCHPEQPGPAYEFVVPDSLDDSRAAAGHAHVERHCAAPVDPEPVRSPALLEEQGGPAGGGTARATCMSRSPCSAGNARSMLEVGEAFMIVSSSSSSSSRSATLPPPISAPAPLRRRPKGPSEGPARPLHPGTARYQARWEKGSPPACTQEVRTMLRHVAAGIDRSARAWPPRTGRPGKPCAEVRRCAWCTPGSGSRGQPSVPADMSQRSWAEDMLAQTSDSMRAAHFGLQVITHTRSPTRRSGPCSRRPKRPICWSSAPAGSAASRAS